MPEPASAGRLSMLEGEISKGRYLELVRGAARHYAVAEDLEDDLERLARILGSVEQETRLREMMESFLVDVEKGYEGIVRILPLEYAKQVICGTSAPFEARNWHYDRKARCVVMNLARGVHEELSGLLHQVYLGGDLNDEDAAERFIELGLGWFRSSSSFGRMLKGKEVKFSAQERAVFGGVGVLTD